MNLHGYATYLLLEHIKTDDFDEKLGLDWTEKAIVASIFCEAMRDAFRVHGYDVGATVDNIALGQVDWLTDRGGFTSEGDSYTGLYLKLNKIEKSRLVREVQQYDVVSNRIAALGPSALNKALSRLAEENEWSKYGENTEYLLEQLEKNFAVPASDRTVQLNHNEVRTAVNSVTEIIDALEQDNGDPEQSGLRERLLGQIKAGRELIQAGEFRAYLLYEVLVRALDELIKRYQNPTISALANAFLGAVVSQLLQAD